MSCARSLMVSGPALRTALYTAYSSGRRPAPAMVWPSRARTRWPTANRSNRNEIEIRRCRPGWCVTASVCPGEAAPPSRSGIYSESGANRGWGQPMVGPGRGSPTAWRSRGVAGLLAALALVAAGCTAGGPAGDRAGSAAPSATRTVTPPAQPAEGPGGRQRRHAGVRTTQVGGSPGSVTIFEPEEPTPRSAPVVVFTQGVGPDDYQGWIDHLVARGSIVVFQDQPFQAVDLTGRRKGPVAGLRAAVRELARPGHVKPEWDHLVLVGHSIGGSMAAQLAADTGRERLPRPKALFVLQPPEEDKDSLRVLRGIPPSTLVLVLASDRDTRVGLEGPKALWAALGHVPPANKDYVLVRSDEHGTPALVASHFLSLSGTNDPPDALDFYGPWKLLDALQSCATARRSEEHTSELQSRVELVCRLLLENKKYRTHCRRVVKHTYRSERRSGCSLQRTLIDRHLWDVSRLQGRRPKARPTFFFF